MAKRFIYVPIETAPYVKTDIVDFKWEAGMPLAQKRASSLNLMASAKNAGVANNIMECSRAGNTPLGVKLSAFNLPYFENKNIKVENVYQGSKVFENIYTGEVVWLDRLYNVDAMSAKMEPILTNEDYRLVEFRLMQNDNVFKANTRHHFYNYIYIKSLIEFLTPDMNDEIMTYDGFTDIMLKWYNGKVTSCQAHAIAMYVGMYKAGVLDKCMSSVESYLAIYK